MYKAVNSAVEVVRPRPRRVPTLLALVHLLLSKSALLSEAVLLPKAALLLLIAALLSLATGAVALEPPLLSVITPLQITALLSLAQRRTVAGLRFLLTLKPDPVTCALEPRLLPVVTPLPIAVLATEAVAIGEVHRPLEQVLEPPLLSVVTPPSRVPLLATEAVALDPPLLSVFSPLQKTALLSLAQRRTVAGLRFLLTLKTDPVTRALETVLLPVVALLPIAAQLLSPAP